MGTGMDITADRERVESPYGGVEWLVPGRVIRAWVEGKWTNQSMAFFNREFLKKIEASPAGKVHIIFDTVAMKAVMVSPNATVKKLNYLRNAKVGTVILYGVPNPQRTFVGLLISVLNGAFTARVGLTLTEEEAMDKITTVDPTVLM